jgi:tetratricopeptide (TPR) repeat protein
MKFQVRSLFDLGRDEEYDKAIDLYNKQMFKEAIELFEEILKRKTSSTSLYHNLAEVYCGHAHRNLGILQFAMGNLLGALEELKKAIEYKDQEPEVYHLIGICQNNLGHFEEAVKTFNFILGIDPSHLPTKLKLGIALHNLKLWDRAAAIYDTILKNNPNFADVHFRLGLTLLGKGSPQSAIVAFEKALEINPRYTEAQKKLGITLAYVGRLDEALRQFDGVIVAYPEYADMHYYCGIVYSLRSDFERAIACFRQALQINSSYRDCLVKLGIVFCRLNRFDEGLKSMKEAQAIDPSDNNLGVTLDVVETIASASADSLEKLSQTLKRVFGEEEPFGRVIQEFNKHIEIRPTISEIIPIIRSLPDEDASLSEILVPLLKDYIKSYPQYPDLHATLGGLYRKLGKTEKAEGHYRAAVEIKADYLEARINLFNTLRQLGKFEDAFVQGQYLMEKNVPYPDIWYGMGMVCFSLSQLGSAMQYLRKSVELNPYYADSYLLMARIFERQRDIEAAREAVEKCLESNPSRETFEKAKKYLESLKTTE